MSDTATCALCGEPMPPGEEMFKFHGYSGSCPKPPIPVQPNAPLADDALLAMWRSVQGPRAELNGPLIRFAALVWRKALESAQSSDAVGQPPNDVRTSTRGPKSPKGLS